LLSADSAVPGLNRNLVYMSEQLVPPRPIVDNFNWLARGFAERSNACDSEASALAAIRDALLRQLLSGAASLDFELTLDTAS
jgi:type I restriction enzyme S subunit